MVRKHIVLFFIISAFLATGCGTSYQRAGFSGGYDETQYAVDVWVMTYSGNAFTTPQKTQEMALLRAAELTLGNGYKFFRVEESNSAITTSSHTTPIQSNTTANVSVYGNSAYGSARSTTSGGQTYNVNKP